MREKKQAPYNKIGIACGVFVAVMLVAHAIALQGASQVGAKTSEIPEEAVTTVGSAKGMNGEVSVEVTATPERIYQIRVLEEDETPGIGSVAIATLPPEIYEAQSLQVDGVTNATMTSEAIKNAIRNALDAAQIATTAFEVLPDLEALKEPDVTYDTDVVVIGAGGAGMTAAVVAADRSAG